MTIEFWDFWSHYGISKKATIIQFRVTTDYHIICCRQKFKTFDDLIKIAIAHEKKNYICEINPSCSFSGSEFVIKSSLNNKKQRYHRNNTIEKDGSIKQPNYLNYGDAQPGEGSMLKEIKSGTSFLCRKTKVHPWIMINIFQ